MRPVGNAADRRRFRLLILGGTSEGRILAERLSEDMDIHIISSLAGRTHDPLRPPGEVRIGGFGGLAGLSAFLREAAIDAVVDATHPFASQIGHAAAEACDALDLPRLRWSRPPWVHQSGDRWTEVQGEAEAADLLSGRARRVFLAIGRQGLNPFRTLSQIWFLIRSIEALPDHAPPMATWIRARGPFSFEDELALLRDHRIDVMIAKASGGAVSYAKIEAARTLALPVILIARPLPPPGQVVDDLAAVLHWIQKQTGRLTSRMPARTIRSAHAAPTSSD